MTVWYITMTFPAPAETFACNDVRTLSQAGTEISVHSLRPAHPASSQLLEERKLAGAGVTHGSKAAMVSGLKAGLSRPGVLFNLLVWSFRRCWRRPAHLAKSLALLPRILQLFAAIERERPEVVHVYWGHYPSLVGYLVQRYLPDTVVTVSLAAYDLEMEYGGTGPVAQRADMVRTLAKVNVGHIQEAFGVPAQCITVIYDGVDLSRFQEANTPKKKRRIATVGRLIASKGMDDVLKVFAKVLARWPDATLVVLGDGPERESLEGLAGSLGVGSSVSFRGHVSHEEVFEEMLQAEIFLFMSRKSSERLPNVVKEAMGCRCLCITTDTPGIEELLEDGRHGFIVTQGDVESAARHIEHIFEEGSSLQEMTEAAFEHLENSFDLTRTVAQYQETWKRLVANKQTRKRARSLTPLPFPNKPTK
jgi:glycosyltransferase involved in cell wall biosynthesis